MCFLSFVPIKRLLVQHSCRGQSPRPSRLEAMNRSCWIGYVEAAGSSIRRKGVMALSFLYGVNTTVRGWSLLPKVAFVLQSPEGNVDPCRLRTFSEFGVITACKKSESLLPGGLRLDAEDVLDPVPLIGRELGVVPHGIPQ